MSVLAKIKMAARKLRLGNRVLRIRQFFQLSLVEHRRLNRARRVYLPQILQAPPLPCAADGLEVHMLLQSKRLLEGMWCYYSFVRFLPGGGCLVVHDDGSLTDGDVRHLQTVFPGCRVIRRPEADAVLNDYFTKHELPNCRRLRDTLVFGLKLFDLALFARGKRVLMLDSDVIFFKAGLELIQAWQEAGQVGRTYYMLDITDAYSIDRRRIKQELGQECLVAFNPGAALIATGQVDFKRLESHLAHQGFWNANGTANYFAELTLWAMELARTNAQPLPRHYAIAPTSPGIDGLTCCHYCGGVRAAYLFYTDGLLKLWSQLPAAGAAGRPSH